MKTAMLGLLAESPIHPGSGRGVGVVDLPVAREAATDYPVLVGSSLKGALRDKFETRLRVESAKGEEFHGASKSMFGSPDRAGGLMIADARLLLLPVRSLTSSYRWATCPHLVERFGRDLARAGVGSRPDQLTVKPGDVLATVREPGPTGDTKNTGTFARDAMFLEERQFTVTGQPPQSLVDAIKPLILHNDTGARIQSRLAVLSDDDFTWFARYGLPIQARNVLEDDTKRSMNLWYEESLPPDTVMYALIAGREDGLLGVFSDMFLTDPYLQVGGNETVGQGWFAATIRRNERSDR